MKNKPSRSLNIKGNKEWEEFLSCLDLSIEDLQQLDGIDPVDIELGSFMKRNGKVYLLANVSEIAYLNKPWLSDYDFYVPASALSGVLIKMSACKDYYQIFSYNTEDNQDV
ncbi:hypothetical protein [Endozoicomonas ascidiicola]|uniref:hypothetical protein n=1 Tax=Endozoicomonas ascidiicola TaxID=1698521 RepID=UPI0008316C8F|nr:hypothetical protein [Endozoicomonas ascidiicola]